jgi:hypothetical protein
MNQYQLNINIDQTGLTQIYQSGQTVAIAQTVQSGLGSGSPLAWISFQPFQTNQVTWAPNYYLYASTTQLQPGATVMLMSMTPSPAQFGSTYTFQNGVFTGAAGGPNALNVANLQSGMALAFGVAQHATVNGSNVLAPTNAVTMLYNQTASFTPTGQVFIFLSSISNNGVVLSQIPSSALAVTLTSQNPAANIGFNDATNTFFLFGQNAALQNFGDLALGRQPELGK